MKITQTFLWKMGKSLKKWPKALQKRKEGKCEDYSTELFSGFVQTIGSLLS
jgi:hypothetical protein